VGLSTAITKDGQTTTTARITFAQGTRDNTLTASSAVATDASKNLVSVTNTGTGNNVLATSPTLVTPILGTPASGVMTNVTGINYDGFKNRIINGAMVIDQRNAGASVTITNTSDITYTVDRFGAYGSVASKFSFQRSTTAPAGFVNSLLVTSLSAYSIGSGDAFQAQQRIEGYNVADLAWGTASAATITLSFWVRSSLTGAFGAAVQNGPQNRSYPFSYTINAANTWEQKTVTIAGDTTGTWATNNTSGLYLTFGLGMGSTKSGTANTWAAADYRSVTGATSVVGTNGATFYITGVQLEKGSTATSFDYRPYGTELDLCYRYYYKVKSSGNSYNQLCTGYNGTTTQSYGIVFFPVTMRTRPTSLDTSGTAGDYSIAYENTVATCNAVPTYAAQSNEYQGMCNFTVASGLTAGQGSRGCSDINNANAFLAWSAEL
jgi:hypothetical protein